MAEGIGSRLSYFLFSGLYRESNVAGAFHRIISRFSMNIYARYFDQDTLVYNIDELLDFLSSIPDIRITQDLVDDIRNYLDNDMPYPKRYKIRPRVYFILIKTNADSLAAFKANRKSSLPNELPRQENEGMINKKEMRLSQLFEERPGWYKGTITFKRVIQIPGTTKFQYQDTTFSACVRTNSGQACYNSIVEHLKNRQDVDLRSQFPSAKGQNFQFMYLGEKIPENLVQTPQTR